jgi:hypothetical protein
MITTVDGRAIEVLVHLASSVAGDGDPRPALLAALAAASLIAAGVEINEQTLPPLVTAISKVAAEEAEKLVPPQDGTAPAADAAA